MVKISNKNLPNRKVLAYSAQTSPHLSLASSKRFHFIGVLVLSSLTPILEPKKPAWAPLQTRTLQKISVGSRPKLMKQWTHLSKWGDSCIFSYLSSYPSSSFWWTGRKQSFWWFLWVGPTQEQNQGTSLVPALLNTLSSIFWWEWDHAFWWCCNFKYWISLLICPKFILRLAYYSQFQKNMTTWWTWWSIGHG